MWRLASNCWCFWPHFKLSRFWYVGVTEQKFRALFKLQLVRFKTRIWIFKLKNCEQLNIFCLHFPIRLSTCLRKPQLATMETLCKRDHYPYLSWACILALNVVHDSYRKCSVPLDRSAMFSHYQFFIAHGKFQLVMKHVAIQTYSIFFDVGSNEDWFVGICLLW